MITIDDTEDARCATGVPGLDEILAGGLPRDRVYLIRGEPGTGKTTLALQFLLAGRERGEPGMYITLSESEEELHAVARSHGWTLHGISIFDLSRVEQRFHLETQNTLFHVREVELNETTSVLCEAIDRAKPARVVFDSLSEMRLLSETSFRFRRQVLLLKQFLFARHVTAMLVDDLTADYGDSIQSLVNGVICLEQELPAFGAERRWLSVTKLRGVLFQGGRHDSRVRTGGLEVFPRLRRTRPDPTEPGQPIATGIHNLDTLLGGGIDRATSTLLLGPAGTGKSTLALQCVLAAARNGERSAVYAFEEGEHQIVKRASGIGMDLRGYREQGLITIRKVDPAEMSPGEFADQVRQAVERDRVRLVVIDSLNGYIHAMAQEHHLVLQLHSLLSYLSDQAVTTVMVLAQQGLTGPMQAPADLTYLADTVIITRYFEALGAVKKAVSVIKKRTGYHEDTLREFQIRSNGIRVGPPLTQFQGVLTGVPAFTGMSESMLSRKDEPQGA